MSLIGKALVKALNHLADQGGWVAASLRPFAGEQVAVHFGEMEVGIAIDGQGRFVERASGQPATVTITLPADAAALALSDPERIFASAKISGPADFAEAIGFVFRNLTWDVEADLAKVFGDIVAHRAHRLGQHALQQLRESAQKATANIAEYLSEESSLLVAVTEMADFSARVDELNDALLNLERRIAKL